MRFRLLCCIIFSLLCTQAYAGPSEEAIQLQKEVELALGTEVIVTGAERSAKRQAELIQQKLDRGHDLYALYENKKLVHSILEHKGMYSIETMIKTHMRQGNYISSHLCGKAIDIRSRHISQYKRKQIVDKINSIEGLQAIYEPSPPHIHIERTAGCK